MEGHAMNTMKAPLLSRKEVCEWLNLKPSRLYYLTSTKQIPFIKFGGSLRFDRDVLSRWVEQHRQGPAV